MRIIGIDPGITRCGIGVIDVDQARRASLVHVETARSSTDLAAHFRLRKISEAIERVINDTKPDIMAIERVFLQDNVQSVTTTMWVMGVALNLAGKYQLPLAIHTPTQIKSAVTGSGAAGKAQVQEMVRRILRLDKVVRPADAADSLAIAICQAWRGDGIQGAGIDGTVDISISGKISHRGALTEAQRKWAEAAANIRRTGAVDPRIKKARKSR